MTDEELKDIETSSAGCAGLPFVDQLIAEIRRVRAELEEAHQYVNPAAIEEQRVLLSQARAEERERIRDLLRKGYTIDTICALKDEPG